MPTWLRTTREYLLLGLSYVEQAMDLAAKPVIVVSRASATVEGWIHGLRRGER